MSFFWAAVVLGTFCLLFGGLSLWASYRESKGIPRTLLAVFGVGFLFLSSFSVLVSTGFSIELTNQAPCENVINSTTLAGNTTSYTYEDSCSSRATPSSIERLYQAYAYILYAIILISVFALMILGLRAVVFKW